MTCDLDKNWNTIIMSGLRYHSWGRHTSVVLVEIDEHLFKALYLGLGPIELIRNFVIDTFEQRLQMFDLLSLWNYHTKFISTSVKHDIDWTS